MKTNILLFISTFVTSMIPYFCHSQTRLNELEQLSTLLRSDYKTVKTFHGTELLYIIQVNTTKSELIEIKSDSSQIRKISFDKEYRCDSIMTFDYQKVLNLDGSQVDQHPPDTTLIVFDYRLGGKNAINSKKYKFTKGSFLLYRTDYYGYDEYDKLLLTIQSDGKSQFLYKYNDSDHISEKYFNGHQIVQYKYDENKGIKTRISDSQVITYHYDKAGLLIKKVLKGKETKTITYEYQK